MDKGLFDLLFSGSMGQDAFVLIVCILFYYLVRLLVYLVKPYFEKPKEKIDYATNSTVIYQIDKLRNEVKDNQKSEIKESILDTYEKFSDKIATNVGTGLTDKIDRISDKFHYFQKAFEATVNVLNNKVDKASNKIDTLDSKFDSRIMLLEKQLRKELHDLDCKVDDSVRRVHDRVDKLKNGTR